MQQASFVTASFIIVVPFSETEYEDKLAFDSLFDYDRTGNECNSSVRVCCNSVGSSDIESLKHSLSR